MPHAFRTIGASNLITTIFQSSDYRIVCIKGQYWLHLAPVARLLPLKAEQLTADGKPGDDLAAELQNLLNALREQRVTFSDVLSRRRNRPVRVSALNLNLTPRCDLACVYCYAHGGDYDRIESDMKLDTILTALESGVGNLDRDREFRFEFFGGEPLLNRDVISGVLTHERMTDQIPRPRVHRISTSLTGVDDEILHLFREGEFILSVSLDGLRETQDRQRPYRNGSGTYDDIVASLYRVREKLPELTLVARMTVMDDGERLPGDIRELRRLNLFDYVSIYPAAMAEGERGRICQSQGFRKAVLALADEYAGLVGEKKNRFQGWLELNRAVGHLLHATAAANHCRAGNGYFTLSPDGMVHPCHRLAGDPAQAIPEGLAGVQNTPRDWRMTVDERASCSSCGIRYVCGGGCKQENLVTSGSMLIPSTDSCAFPRLLFDASLVAMNSIQNSSLARERVAESARDLSRLFVLCGQDLVAVDRNTVERLIAEHLQA